MAAQRRTTTGRTRRRLLFRAWVGFAILGGLFIMIGGPFAERYWGHGVIAMIDLAVVFFLTATGLAWLVVLVLGRRRPRNSGDGDYRGDHAPNGPR